ncbi:hypothetical protein HPB49_015937 [Dermacentor silvarum]|uniref:Uncharacterized protein n=1 Tax=Dermacentor silvarum TaxID=543639 RepID=A0ACB8DPU5_DERSI|nr:hypothetical protein HPB49_015937 [Dermacentor silvarum]
MLSMTSEVMSTERQPLAAGEPSSNPQSTVHHRNKPARSIDSALGDEMPDKKDARGITCHSDFTADSFSAKEQINVALPLKHELPHTAVGTAAYQPSAELTEPEELTTASRFPLATLIVIFLQVQAHLNFLNKHYPERCASVAAILHDGLWERVAPAAFHHDNIVHITANVASFFFKGLILEAALGTKYFVCVLAIVVILVGVVNLSLLKMLCTLAGTTHLETTCMHTFAGVVVALELLHREHFCGSTIHLGGKLVVSERPLTCVLLELLILCVSSPKSFVPMVSGLLVGLLLAEGLMGKFIIRMPRRPGRLHVCGVPGTAVTCLFIACACIAHASGPYPILPAVDQATWTLEHSPFVLPLVYVGNVCHLAYVLLSLLAVGQRLERDLGHYRFLALLVGLILAVTVLRDGLPAVIWKHLLRRRDPLPALFRRPGDDCGCALFCAVLALKAVYHRGRGRSLYEMASFPVHMPFWPGVALELMLLHLQTHQSSSFGHVIGVLLGLAVARFWWQGRPRQAGSSSSDGGPAGILNDAPAKVAMRAHHD